MELKHTHKKNSYDQNNTKVNDDEKEKTHTKVSWKKVSINQVEFERIVIF